MEDVEQFDFLSVQTVGLKMEGVLFFVMEGYGGGSS
jgi:hypothetical protein